VFVLHRGRGWSSGSRALPSTVQHNQPQQGHEHRDRREQDVVDHDHTRSSPCAGTMPVPFHQKDHAPMSIILNNMNFDMQNRIATLKQKSPAAGGA
jgi:hypothetical protein